MKYRIIVDTNILYQEKTLSAVFNVRELEEIQKFIREKKLTDVNIGVTEITYEERIKHLFDYTRELVSNAKKSVEELDIYDIKTDLSAYDTPKYEEILREKALEELKERKIEVLKLPQLTTEVLTRALAITPPFRKSDKGYKDTLIWLTILEDVSKHKDSHYILLTENTKDFQLEELEAEFSKRSTQSFRVIKSAIQIQEILDQELKLDLKIKEQVERQESELLKHIGEIMVELHKKDFVTIGSYPHKKIIGFKLKNVEIGSYFSFGTGSTVILFLKAYVEQDEWSTRGKYSSPSMLTSPTSAFYSNHEGFFTTATHYNEGESFDTIVEVNVEVYGTKVTISKVQTNYPLSTTSLID